MTSEFADTLAVNPELLFGYSITDFGSDKVRIPGCNNFDAADISDGGMSPLLSILHGVANPPYGAL